MQFCPQALRDRRNRHTELPNREKYVQVRFDKYSHGDPEFSLVVCCQPIAVVTQPLLMRQRNRKIVTHTCLRQPWQENCYKEGQSTLYFYEPTTKTTPIRTMTSTPQLVYPRELADDFAKRCTKKISTLDKALAAGLVNEAVRLERIEEMLKGMFLGFAGKGYKSATSDLQATFNVMKKECEEQVQEYQQCTMAFDEFFSGVEKALKEAGNGPVRQ